MNKTVFKVLTLHFAVSLYPGACQDIAWTKHVYTL